MTVQVRNRRKGQTWLSMLPRCTAALGLLASLAFAPNMAAAGTYVVAPEIPETLKGGGEYACYGASGIATHTKIQEAIDAAKMSGDASNRIEVCPGYYYGFIIDSLTQSFTIVGLGDAFESFFFEPPMGTKVGLPPGLVPDKTQVVVSPTAMAPAGPIIDVVAAVNVKLINMTVDGLSSMVPGPDRKVTGIRYGLVEGHISYVAVQNIRNANGGAKGSGIKLVGHNLMTLPAFPPAPKLVRIYDCMVRNVTRVGIKVVGKGVDADVQQCMLIGPDMPVVHAPNGFQVSEGGMGSIQNSTLSGFKSPNPEGGAGSAILFYCAMAASARSNMISDSDIGGSLVDNDGGIFGGNTIKDTEIAISMQTHGSFYSAPACFPPLVPTQNSQILSNIILDPTEAGIHSTSFTSTPADNVQFGQVPQDNNVQDNLIMVDPMIELAPIAVSSGQNNRFIENTIFTGPTSRIVDEGLNNTFANYCNPDNPTPCNPLSAGPIVKRSASIN